jgi:hypothetical protein
VDNEGFPFLNIGHIIAVFQILGITFLDIDISNRIEKGIAITFAIDFKNIAGYPSGDLEDLGGSFCR